MQNIYFRVLSFNIQIVISKRLPLTSVARAFRYRFLVLAFVSSPTHSQKSMIINVPYNTENIDMHEDQYNAHTNLTNNILCY
jgi:hypothetical protein